MAKKPVAGKADTTARKQRGPGRPFKPGQSGNPAGRPRGTRSRLSDDFLVEIHDIWGKHGKAAIDKVAAERPADFVKLVASVLPRDINLKADEPVFTEALSNTIQWLEGLLASHGKA